MRRISRYSIPATDNEVHSVQFPKSGNIINIDSKSGLVYEDPDKPRVFIDLWVMFDNDHPLDVKTRHFVVMTTGEPIDDDLVYLDTVVVKHEDLFGGAAVYHLFEKTV